jgi:octaprenyl-diphosphate synthase
MPETDKTSNTPPSSVRESETFFAPLREHIHLLDEFLNAQIEEFEPSVREPVFYTLTHRGKRLRPGLVFYSGWTGNTPTPELVRAAAVVELVHLATLIHDDILDGADMRHNSPTLAARYGRHTAVLLGDALFAHALKLASDFPTTEVCRLVSVATRQVCSGEICQTFERGNAHLSLDQYFRIIRLKTAELFEVSCRLGASLSSGDPDAAYVDACALYGRHLGVAYQIFDDIMDFSGSEAGIGKTLGTDFASGKFTLPALLYLRRLEPNAAAALVSALEKHELLPASLTARMVAADIPQECLRVFLGELEKAEAAIAPFAASPAFSSLRGLVGYVRRQLSEIRF